MTSRMLICGMLVTMATFPANAGDRLTMNVSPSVAFAPAKLVVRMNVESNPDNRSIAIVAESPEFYRSSEIQLDGERAPRVTQLEFKSLPSGSYNVRATLYGVGGKELALARREIHIISSEGAH